MEQVETLIIGGGQAGLAMSHHLSRLGAPHLVVERHRIAERWRSERWDGLRFQSPNALVRLPGYDLPATDPDAFATAGEIVAFLTDYATRIRAPVRTGVNVTRLARDADDFVAGTASGAIRARNVVVATGPFQRPVMPALLPDAPEIVQLPASAYRNPEQLPDGAVLVVGAGASGSQIAHELLRAGRRVFFSIGKHRRAPRRYRGHDHVWWWIETGMDQTPVARRPADRAPLVHTGAYGGHTIDFRQFAADGMVLLGRAQAAEHGVMGFADDLLANLAHGDAAFQAFMDFVDAHIRRTGMALPEDPDAHRLVPAPAGMVDAPRQLDLKAAGIRSVIWATGYALDFGWIDLPVLDPRGTPLHRDGITGMPGLYFLGLPFLSRMSSSFIFGVGADAERLAGEIAARSGRTLAAPASRP